MESIDIPLFARQAIYDNQCKVTAFELLFRQSDINECVIDNYDAESAEKATSNVLSEFFSNVPVEEVVGDKKAFINFARKNLLSDLPYILPKERIVIEILETVDCDEELISALKKLKNHGYTIALDDFEYNDKNKELLEFADIVKIDILNKSNEEIKQCFQQVEHFKGDLLAEKVEDVNQFEYCNSLGFKLFQGFFFKQA